MSVGAALTAETRGLFGAERLARLRQGAYLYNIARGNIVDPAALLAALQSGHLAGAGLDHFEGEQLPKVIDTGFYWYDKTNIDDPKIQAVLYQ